MTHEEALNERNRTEFIEVMYKELGNHIECKHWKVVPLSSIPKYKKAIPMVRSMKQKCNPMVKVSNGKYGYVLEGTTPCNLSISGPLTLL